MSEPIHHSWHVTLYVTRGGLTTGAVPDAKVPTTLAFDARECFPLEIYARELALESVVG